MRMLLAAGAALVVASVAVEVAHPDTVWPRRQMPLAAQWKLTFAGMFALTAGLFGVAAFWNRTRDNNAVAIQLALWATLAAIPAGAMHLLFQIERLSYSVHDKWFASLLATSAGVRIGVVGAAIVVITQSNRTFRLADGTARERLRPGRTLPRVRHA